MKLMVAILILVAGFIFAPLSGAADLIRARAVLEDPSGTLSIADVAGREFQPVGPTLSRGYTSSVYWLRLRVRAPAKGSEVVLFIRQPFLNEIRLYQKSAPTAADWESRVTGNHYAYRARDRARSSLGFTVNPAAPEATYYLRLKTSSVLQLSVEALDPGEAQDRDHQLDLLELFFVSSMLLLLVWALHSYLLDRLPVVRLFAVHQAVYTLYGVAITGYLAPFLPDGIPRLADLSTAIPYCGVTFTTLLFCRELFKPYEPPPLLLRGLNLLLAAFPLQLAAMALGYTSVAAILNFLLVRFSWWYFVAIVFALRKESSPSRRLLQAFFVSITLLFTAFWLTDHSAVSTHNNLYGRQLLIANGLIIGGLFAMILNARSRRFLLEARQSTLELQAKSEFLALVSHEIRTPLNALVGFSSLARTTADPAKLDQYHAIIEDSSRSLMALVNGILDLSKLEAGRMELEAVPLNLRRLVGSLEEQYRPLAEQKNLAFQVNFAGDAPTWMAGDPVRLRQVLDNLLSNALKFTASGALSCSVSRLAPPGPGAVALLRFEVRDTGIGIPEGSRAQLFQPFCQLDPSISRKFGGTGLGLAIVRDLTLMMEGSISVESWDGVGSCFVVELPLRETGPLAEELPEPPVALASGSVLVVDDNGFSRQLLGDILVSWGQQVTLAQDGGQALQQLRERRFDLVLMDIRMPDMNGIEVARRIRAWEQERQETPVPIIAISADADAATSYACLAAGIGALLAKPVIPEQLARAMAAQRAAAPQGDSGEGWHLSLKTRGDLGSDPERVRQYREMLLQDIEEELQCLQSALERGDRNVLGHAAHTLKGLFGHLANRDPAETAGWLQSNAASAGPEQLRQAIRKLECNFAKGEV